MTDICITQDPEFYSHLDERFEELKIARIESNNFTMASNIYFRAIDMMLVRFDGVLPTPNQILFITKCVSVFRKRGENIFASTLDERLTEWCEVVE